MGCRTGPYFSKLPRVGDRAAHLVVQKHLPVKTEGRPREIIRTWIKNGVLAWLDYQDVRNNGEKVCTTTDEQVTHRTFARHWR